MQWLCRKKIHFSKLDNILYKYTIVLEQDCYFLLLMGCYRDLTWRPPESCWLVAINSSEQFIYCIQMMWQKQSSGFLVNMKLSYMPPWDYYSKDSLLFCSSDLDTFKDSTSHHNFLFVSFSDLYFPEISLLGTWLINKCDCLLKPTLLSYVN